MNKGYANLYLGFCDEALTDLTGAPSLYYWCSIKDKAKWKMLYDADQSNFIMTAISIPYSKDKIGVNVHDRSTGIIYCLGHENM